MADTYRHTVAVKSHILPDPGKGTGIVIDIATSGTAIGNGGIIPVAFQSVAVAEGDLYIRTVGIAIVGGIELFPAVGVGFCLRCRT